MTDATDRERFVVIGDGEAWGPFDEYGHAWDFSVMQGIERPVIRELASPKEWYDTKNWLEATYK